MLKTRARLDRRTFVKGGLGAVALASGVRPARTRATQAGTEVSFMNWDPIEGTPLETAIKAFQEQTGITVNVQPTPGTGTAYETKMRTLLASGSPPDVMRVNDDYVRGYSLTGQLLDLRPMMDQSGINPDDYNQHPFNFPVQPDGAHTAWAIGTQPAVIVYNVDQFKAAGVPLPPGSWTGENWTWDNFLDAAAKLTVPDQRWGALVFDDTSYETIYPVNNGDTTGIYSKDGTQFTLAEPKGVEAVQWVVDLTCKHQVQPPWSEVQESDAGNKLFVAGRLGMIERTFGVSSYLRNNVKDFTWDVAPVPAKDGQQTTIATLIVFCIPKAAKNPAGAWELLKFLGGADGGKIFAEAGYFLPSSKEALALIKPVNGVPEHINVVTEAVSHATNENFSQNIERARQIYRPQLELVYLCQQTADQVLPAIKGEVEAALAGQE